MANPSVKARSYPLVNLLDGPEASERDRWLIAPEAVDGNERAFREWPTQPGTWDYRG